MPLLNVLLCLFSAEANLLISRLRNEAWKAQRGSLLRKRVQQLDYLLRHFRPGLSRLARGEESETLYCTK